MPDAAEFVASQDEAWTAKRGEIPLCGKLMAEQVQDMKTFSELVGIKS